MKRIQLALAVLSMFPFCIAIIKAVIPISFGESTGTPESRYLSTASVSPMLAAMRYSFSAGELPACAPIAAKHSAKMKFRVRRPIAVLSAWHVR